MTEPNDVPIPEDRIASDERSGSEPTRPTIGTQESTGSDPGAIEGHAIMASTESGAGSAQDRTEPDRTTGPVAGASLSQTGQPSGPQADNPAAEMGQMLRNARTSGMSEGPVGGPPPDDWGQPSVSVTSGDIPGTGTSPGDTFCPAQEAQQNTPIPANNPTNPTNPAPGDTLSTPPDPTSSSTTVTGASTGGGSQPVALRDGRTQNAVDGRTVSEAPHTGVSRPVRPLTGAAGRVPPDHQRCTATSKHTGQRCKQWRAPDRTVCKYHGGRSLTGPANPAWKGAGYSRVLPMSVKDAYQRIHDDPDILSLRADAALMQLRLDSLVGRLGGGETGSQWLALKAAREQLRTAMATGDNASFDDAIRRMCELIDRGASEEALWPEIEAAVESKSKVVMREWKRLVDLQQVMTAEQVMALIVAIMASVKRNVRSVDALKAIAGDLQILLNASRRKGPVVDQGPRPAQA